MFMDICFCQRFSYVNGFNFTTESLSLPNSVTSYHQPTKKIFNPVYNIWVKTLQFKKQMIITKKHSYKFWIIWELH